MLKSKLWKSDRVFYHILNESDNKIYAWYSWDDVETRPWRDIKPLHNVTVFGCIRKGIFHYVE